MRKLSALAVSLAAMACAEGERPAPVREIWGAQPAADRDADPRRVEVALTARHAEMNLFGHPVTMMTYDGLFPGPMIEANAGDEIVVHFTNALEEPTTIHWHGMRVPDAMDGNPRIREPLPPGGTFDYRFTAREAASYWYHPHHRAHEQLERGLYGSIVVRAPNDPTFDRERVLLLDEIRLDDSGEFPPTLVEHMERVHGRMGTMFLTNGQESSEVSAAADQNTVERWRIVNTSNARTMQLSLRGASFRVIGTDGGLLRTPYTTERLQIAVGQRYDLEVTYAEPGRVELISHQLEVVTGEIVEVAEHVVFAVDVAESNWSLPEIAWPAQPEPPARTASREVEIELDAQMDEASGVTWLINGVADRQEPLFTFGEGDTVLMRIVNLKNPEHPFHLHGQFFEIAGGAEPGLKDTVLVPGRSTVEIVAYLDNPGRWMAHCHILEHVELGMMSEIVVEPR
jgi:FtsP/CotA-like multicopper oxidase with cupredoxin domain